MSLLLTGQTDSGKSTIAGHLLWKVGYFSTLPEEDKKIYRSKLENLEENNSKAKFSVLMDLLDGELMNNKSKTREFSIQNFQYKNKEYSLIDTPGLQLMLHHRTGEYEVEIEDIHSGQNKLVVVRNSTPVKLIVGLQKKISYRVGDKVVLRFQKNTVGFGVVVN